VFSRSKISAAVMVVAALGVGWYVRDRSSGQLERSRVLAAQQAVAVDAGQIAYQSHSQGRVIDVTGKVDRILSDDRDGSPHQRFTIHTPSGLSVLIAHNLDLAPRLDGLAPGDAVAVRGEYVWNEKGGLMHWTHDDPQGRHQNGHIEWRGRRYQ
jgi:ferric iron reductase protein FhuF